MTTSFVVHGGKVNNMLTINGLKRIEIEAIRNIIIDAKKTQLYERLGEHLCPYTPNKILHGLQHPHDYQTKR